VEVVEWKGKEEEAWILSGFYVDFLRGFLFCCFLFYDPLPHLQLYYMFNKYYIEGERLEYIKKIRY